MGVIEASGKRDAALRFEQCVLSGDGQAVMESFGYRRLVVNE